MQRGQLFHRSGAWYVRYYEGARRVTKHLGYLKHFPSRTAIQPEMDAFMRRVNSSTAPAVTLDEFIEHRYLPYAKELRPSTYQGYVSLWTAKIKGLGTMRVREYRTVDVQNLLNAIAGKKLLAASTHSHIKAFLSGVFRYAVLSGVRDDNPVRECKLPRVAKPTRVTYAYNLSEIQRMLLVLEMEDTVLMAAVATAAYSGLRLSELNGLEWGDYDGHDLRINRSVWHGHVSDPKTRASRDYVPVIPRLKEILEKYQASLASSFADKLLPGVRMFPSLNPDQRQMIRALRGTGIEWKGWHAFRRGLATNLAELGVSDKVIQRILRHSKVTVTRDHYIKVRDASLDAAMEKLSGAVGPSMGQA